jgi:hypothetical protein
MKIGRLNIRVQGDASAGRAFARHFADALACQVPWQGGRGRVDRLDVPPVQAHPGDSPRRLAERSAAAVAQVLKSAIGGHGK